MLFNVLMNKKVQYLRGQFTYQWGQFTKARYIICVLFIVKYCKWLIQLENLRRGANSQNTGLGNPGVEKGKGKGKKASASFPLLQVGADPYSDGLS